MEELLPGAAQGNGTLESVVFKPADRVLYVTAGTGAPNHGFALIDLKPYFRQGDEPKTENRAVPPPDSVAGCEVTADGRF